MSPFYKIGTICSSMTASHSSRFNPEERPPFLLNRRFSGPQSRPGPCGEKNKNVSSAGIGTPNCKSRSLSHCTDGLFPVLDLKCAFVKFLHAVADTFSIYIPCS